MDMEPLNSDYFASYEDLEVHKLMLEDEPRNLAYQEAILNNKAYFKDKIVMDVGCGTGILSIFCAQAGAKKVYAVEASEVAHLARDVIHENGYSSIIEVIQSRVEDVVLPDDIKVDAIVSEWMGFYLLHEGMLDSVLHARDAFLKEGGEIFPESAVIYVAPCSVPAFYDKWDDINGVSMEMFAKHYRKSVHNKPEILGLQPENLLGHEVALSWVNLREDKPSDLDSYSIQHVVGANKDGFYQGICVWFECNFPDLSEGREEKRVILDTSPRSPATHWKQTVIVLPDDQPIEEEEPIAFKLEMTRDQTNRRRYNLQMTMLDPEKVDHPQPCSCHMTKCILIRTIMQQHSQHAKEALQPSNGLVEEPIDDDDDDVDDDDVGNDADVDVDHAADVDVIAADVDDKLKK